MAGSVTFMCCNGSQSMSQNNQSFNMTLFMLTDRAQKLPIVAFGNKFYAYVTPVIFVIGMIGNLLSLGVFLSKNLRYMSASRYLATLAAVDILTLLSYVLSEWLRRGLKVLSPENDVHVFDTAGVCQIWLYMSYISRFLSAWLIVCFTCERYICVCLPLRRRNLGSLQETKKIIACLIILSMVVVVYKPIMSEVRTMRNQTACTSRESHIYESFILDSIYAMLTFFVPFVVILVLNILIIRRLVHSGKRHEDYLVTEESHIRLEFTFILLAVSAFFITLNLPFFVVWVRNFLHSWSFYHANGSSGYVDNSFDYWVGVLSITRTIFYMNYCINFFLYSVTGAYFRRELVALFTKSYTRQDDCGENHSTRHTNTRNRQSWV